jgi:hypothetical protein
MSKYDCIPATNLTNYSYSRITGCNMADAGAYKAVCKKDFDPAKVAALAIKSPECLSQAIAGLSESAATIKYGCDKVLRYLATSSPGVLYPHFDQFAKTILRWGAIEIISHLATIDSENKFEPIFETYFSPIKGPVLITASNLIKASARIAKARPELVDRIAARILAVETARHQTAECRQIALGQAVKAFDEMFNQIAEKDLVVAFVRRRLKSRRNSTKQAAEKFLRKWKLS